VPRESVGLLTKEFPGEDVSKFLVCNTCYQSLVDNKVARLSRSNGFEYPDIYMIRYFYHKIEIIRVFFLFLYGSYAFCLMYTNLLQSLEKGHYMCCAG